MRARTPRHRPWSRRSAPREPTAGDRSLQLWSKALQDLRVVEEEGCRDEHLRQLGPSSNTARGSSPAVQRRQRGTPRRRLLESTERSPRSVDAGRYPQPLRRPPRSHRTPAVRPAACCQPKGEVVGDDHRGAPAELTVGVAAQACHRLRRVRDEAEDVRRRVGERQLLRQTGHHDEGRLGTAPGVLTRAIPLSAVSGPTRT